MAVVETLSEEEKYLAAILLDQSGVDVAEFIWQDETSNDGVFRCWDFQYPWYRTGGKLQIDQCARAIGKSIGIQMRAFSFPFSNPGEEMLITAPELIHLNPVTKSIEDRIMASRITREMLQTKRGRTGIVQRPFEARFKNGARIVGRIPQKDGKGVKGMHPKKLEMDEAQDYPEPGWIELTETLKYGDVHATWRAHGVTRGVRDYFWKLSQPDSGWTVHRYCLPEGTLVYGVDEAFPIEEAKLGDRVWSIEANGVLVEDEVTALIDNGVRETWKVHAKGGFELETTFNHPYLILSREGTRRTRRELEFEWVDARDIKVGDYLIGVDHLDQTGVETPTFESVTEMLTDYSPDRSFPEWVWRAPRTVQMAFLAGYMMGDGSRSKQPRGQDPWQISTSSIVMAKQLRALAHYLGLRPTALSSKPNDGGIATGGDVHTFYAYPDASWFWQIPGAYSSVQDGVMLEGLDKRLVARRVDSSEPTGRSVQTYDITVGTHHNFIAEGVVVHNTAMHRPDWSDDERTQKAELYGSRHSPDYRRNILGAHGDAQNPLFVLSRLMECVDTEETSEYNRNEYSHIRISDEKIRQSGMPVQGLVEPPPIHKKYERIWLGADIGLTNHPTEILAFAEIPDSKQGGKNKNELDVTMRVIGRIHMERISIPMHVEIFRHLYDFYRPVAFAMDRTGIGLPLYQTIIEGEHHGLANAMRGYDFGSKIQVGWELDDENYDEWSDEEPEAIMANVLEYSSDQLRMLVDKNALRLPWDLDMLREFQGQTYVVRKSTQNPYGRKVFSQGKFHTLDAARMAVLAWKQRHIEAALNTRPTFEPVLDSFVM